MCMLNWTERLFVCPESRREEETTHKIINIIYFTFNLNLHTKYLHAAHCYSTDVAAFPEFSSKSQRHSRASSLREGGAF